MASCTSTSATVLPTNIQDQLKKDATEIQQLKNEMAELRSRVDVLTANSTTTTKHYILKLVNSIISDIEKQIPNLTREQSNLIYAYLSYKNATENFSADIQRQKEAADLEAETVTNSKQENFETFVHNGPNFKHVGWKEAITDLFYLTSHAAASKKERQELDQTLLKLHTFVDLVRQQEKEPKELRLKNQTIQGLEYLRAKL